MGLQKKKREKFACWAFLTPTLIFLAVTALFPLLYSVYLSFFRVKLNMPNQKPVFVGLSNYIKMISDDMLHVSTWNTMVFAFISVALEVILGLMVAMVICSDKMWSRVVTSLFMIPMIMAPVATSFNLPLVIWLMMGFFEQIPYELEESAMLDGSSFVHRFFHVILPITKPGLVASAILTFTATWNEFLFAVILSINRLPSCYTF